MKRYIARSLKYLLLLCVLYVGLVWLVWLFGDSEPNIHPWMQIEATLSSSTGVWMIAAFVALAAFYPKFGFMRSRIEGIEWDDDSIRLINAMQVHGFKLVEEHDRVKIFRADTLFRRIALMWEDTIEVRRVEGGIELSGLRRAVARVAYQLKAYKHNSRYEA